MSKCRTRNNHTKSEEVNVNIIITAQQLGSEWSKMGHQIKTEKRNHERQVHNLIGEVQAKLDFTGCREL